MMRPHASARSRDISSGIAAKAEIVVHAGIAHFRRNGCRRVSRRCNEQQEKEGGKLHRVSQCCPPEGGPRASVGVAEVIHGDIPSHSYGSLSSFTAKWRRPINRRPLKW